MLRECVRQRSPLRTQTISSPTPDEPKAQALWTCTHLDSPGICEMSTTHQSRLGHRTGVTAPKCPDASGCTKTHAETQRWCGADPGKVSGNSQLGKLHERRRTVPRSLRVGQSLTKSQRISTQLWYQTSTTSSWRAGVPVTELAW